MGGKKPTIEDVKEWPDQNETTFLQILWERIQDDPSATPPSIRSGIWEAIDDQLFLSVGDRYGAEKLRGKYNRLRIKYRHFLELLDHADVQYDQTSNTIFASDEIWQMFIKKHGNFKALKKSGLKNYELLSQVFKSEVPRHTEIALVSDDGIKRGEGRSKGKRIADNLSSCPGEEEAKFEKLDSCVEEVEKHKEVVANKKHKTTTSSFYGDPYSIEACMDVLEAMKNISDNAYAKVVELFPNPDWRKIFMKMSVVRRNSWVAYLDS
ncbi:hypothetical protein ACFE04_017732 [Oxalis oulophora]